MSDEEAERSAVEKLMKLLDDQRPDMFTEQEVASLKQWAKTLAAMEAVGSLGRVTRHVLLWFGSMILIWLAFRDAIAGWVRGLVS